MSEELVRQIDKLERRIDSLIKPEVSRQLVVPFLDIPGKVGLWYAGDVQRSTGNIYDASGQGRTLTYNGNPIFKQLSNGIAYVDLDGTGDLFSRPDETDLDILGTEAHNVGGSPGLTIGGWFWANTLAASMGLVGKWLATGNQRSYLLFLNGTYYPQINTSPDGIDFSNSQASSVIATVNSWLFIVGRFIPGASIDIFFNGTWNKSGSASASLFNSTANFELGSFNAGTSLLTGRKSVCFLSANALPDTLINKLFQQTRVFYGV